MSTESDTPRPARAETPDHHDTYQRALNQARERYTLTMQTALTEYEHAIVAARGRYEVALAEEVRQAMKGVKRG